MSSVLLQRHHTLPCSLEQLDTRVRTLIKLDRLHPDVSTVTYLIEQAMKHIVDIVAGHTDQFHLIDSSDFLEIRYYPPVRTRNHCRSYVINFCNDITRCFVG